MRACQALLTWCARHRLLGGQGGGRGAHALDAQQTFLEGGGQQNNNDLNCQNRHDRDKHCSDKEELGKHRSEQGGGKWTQR